MATETTPPEDCNWCSGFSDGYRVGPNGVEPDGSPAEVGYNEALFADPDYRAGLSEGRSDRIDEELLANGGHPREWLL